MIAYIQMDMCTTELFLAILPVTVNHPITISLPTTTNQATIISLLITTNPAMAPRLTVLVVGGLSLGPVLVLPIAEAAVPVPDRTVSHTQ